MATPIALRKTETGVTGAATARAEWATHLSTVRGRATKSPALAASLSGERWDARVSTTAKKKPPTT
jgi:hypothetical protein